MRSYVGDVSHRYPRRNGPSYLSVVLLACALVVSGCSLLGEADEQLTADQAPDDSEIPPLQADTLPGESDNEQATLDDSSTPNSDPGDSGSDGDSGGDDGDEDEDTMNTASTSSTNADGSTTDPVDATDFCEAPKRNNFDIAFAAGASSATLDSVVPADEVDLYRIEVGNDQIMTIKITSSKDNAIGGLMAPDGSVDAVSFTERTVLSTSAGIYRICVSPGGGTASYELAVSVIDDNTPTKITADWCGTSVNDRGEIRFAGGASSGSVADSVIRGERDLYTIEAAAGQELEANISSLEDNAVFDFRTPSGDIPTTEANGWIFTLPESGVYEFCVGGTRGNASYTLDVSIN